MLDVHAYVICLVVQIQMKAHEDLLADVIQSHQELSIKYDQMLNVSLQLCSCLHFVYDAGCSCAMQVVFCFVLYPFCYAFVCTLRHYFM